MKKINIQYKIISKISYNIIIRIRIKYLTKLHSKWIYCSRSDYIPLDTNVLYCIVLYSDQMSRCQQLQHLKLVHCRHVTGPRCWNSAKAPIRCIAELFMVLIIRFSWWSPNRLRCCYRFWLFGFSCKMFFFMYNFFYVQSVQHKVLFNFII